MQARLEALALDRVGSGNAPVVILGSDDRAPTSFDDVLSDVHAAIAP